MEYLPPQPPVLLYKPRHERQEEVDAVWHKTRCLLLTGDAGAGKTHPAIFHSLRELLSGKIEKLMIGRPAVTVDEEHGFLPGTLEDKLGPWLYAAKDCVGDKNWAAVRASMNVEPVAIGMSRGRTIKKAVMLIDEAQNLSRKQLRMLASRVGSGGKLVLCGDAAQSDLRGEVPLLAFAERMRGIKGFKEIQFLPEDVKQCRGEFAFAVNAALAGW